VSYLRLIVNSTDAVAFNRIINVPPRKLGIESQKALGAWAEKTAGSRSAACKLLLAEAELGSPPPTLSAIGLKAVAHKSFGAFREHYRKWRALSESGATVAEVLKAVIRDTFYLEYMKDVEGDADERAMNVRELLNLASLPANAEDAVLDDVLLPPLAGMSGLRTFLENAALLSSQEMRKDEAPDAVQLMTMHASKGLEFHAVFAIGLEEGVLPSSKSMALEPDPTIPDADEKTRAKNLCRERLEEERRNLYVAMTRAKQRLYLSYALERSMFGGTPSESKPSRFLKDIMASKTVHQRLFGLRCATPPLE